jgi:hypothetical protein
LDILNKFLPVYDFARNPFEVSSASGHNLVIIWISKT